MFRLCIDNDQLLLFFNSRNPDSIGKFGMSFGVKVIDLGSRA